MHAIRHEEKMLNSTQFNKLNKFLCPLYNTGQCKHVAFEST